MGRSGAVCILVSLLSAVGGCQLISHDNLAAKSGTTDKNPAVRNQPDLPPLRNCTTPKEVAEVCVTTADALAKEGNAGEAIALYEKAIQNGAGRQLLARRLAALYDQQKDYNQALQEYHQLLQHDPRDADLLNDVGYCYYNQGNWIEAEKYLRQALALNSASARAWINLGMTLAQANRTPESLEAFTKAVSPAQAQCNLAFILTTQGKFEDAKVAYRQALAQEPNLALARSALAKLEKAGTPPAPHSARDVGVRMEERDGALIERPSEAPLP